MTNKVAEALHHAVTHCAMITRKDADGRDCSLWLQGREFMMVKQGAPSHSISADPSITSPERLRAHWDGFCGVSQQVEQTPVPVTPVIAIAPLDRGLRAGDQVSYFRNQGDREAEVLAVLGDEALVAYEMPSGVTYLNIVSADGSDGAYRAVSPKSLPLKWRNAVAEQFGQATISVRCGPRLEQRFLV